MVHLASVNHNKIENDNNKSKISTIGNTFYAGRHGPDRIDFNKGDSVVWNDKLIMYFF